MSSLSLLLSLSFLSAQFSSRAFGFMYAFSTYATHLAKCDHCVWVDIFTCLHWNSSHSYSCSPLAQKAGIIFSWHAPLICARTFPRNEYVIDTDGVVVVVVVVAASIAFFGAVVIETCVRQMLMRCSGFFLFWRLSRLGYFANKLNIAVLLKVIFFMRLVWNQYKKATWPLCSRNEFSDRIHSSMCRHAPLAVWFSTANDDLHAKYIQHILISSDCILSFCLCYAVHSQSPQIFFISILFVCTEPHRTAPHRTALHNARCVQFIINFVSFSSSCLVGVCECGNRTNCHFTLTDHLNATLYGILCV